MWRRVLGAVPSLFHGAAAGRAAAGSASAEAVAVAAVLARVSRQPLQAGWAQLLHSSAWPPTGISGWQACTSASCSPRCFATITSRKAAANPGLKFWKPTSPGQRGRVTIRRTGIWRGGPKRCLARGGAKSGGRNNSGRITVWHRGGGARKVLRTVDFRRRASEFEGVVERLEYDPGRTSYIALVRHKLPTSEDTQALLAHVSAARAAALRSGSISGSGGGKAAAVEGAAATSSSSSSGGSSSSNADEAYLKAVQGLLDHLKGPRLPKPFSYILAPQDLKPGDVVASGEAAPIRPGNMMPLRDIPVGMPIHNLELKPGRGAALCRAAGCVASIVNKQETHAIVRLPSGEQRLFPMSCRATIGAVSNPQHKNVVIGKAGYARLMGRRPIVRGVAMNPVDHPHGGGTAGGRPSVTPWGIPCKGHRTRRNSPTAKWVLVPRKRGKAGGATAAGAGQ